MRQLTATGTPESGALADLFERTAFLFSDAREQDPGWVWCRNILPKLAPACREAAAGETAAQIPVVERWLHWERDASEACLADAGPPATVAGRRRALRLLLTATRTVLCAPARAHSLELAAQLLAQTSPDTLPGFGIGLCACLIDYLKGEGDGEADHDLVRISCPLVLNQSFIIEGRDTNVVMTDVEVRIAPGMRSGAVFLHPEQFGLRLFDDTFAAACFTAAPSAAAAAALLERSTGLDLPNITLRFLPRKASQEIYLANAVLTGSSAGAAVAAALCLLYRRAVRKGPQPPIELPPHLAASIAVNDSHGVADGRLHSVGKLDDKIRGCALAGIQTLFVASAQNSREVRQLAAHNGDIQITGVHDLADLVAHLERLTAPTPLEPLKKASPERLPPAARRKVSLLYKRGVPDDEHVLHLLERHLTALGHEVFIDRHLLIGSEWEAEINRQVRSADAVVVLLSESSIHSKSLQHEVATAWAAARASASGRPLLIPLRICYEGPLTEGLADALARLQYGLWQGPPDDERVARQVAEAIATPRSHPPLGRHPSLPAYFDPFFGRAEELTRLVDRLCDPGTRLVTLTGTGGCGKTRLATEAAQALLASFPGGVWFVPLQGITDPTHLPEQILRSLGVTCRPDRDPMEEIAISLAGAPCLLILDNFEQIVGGGRAVIRDLLACVPALTCLITSRIRLGLSAEIEWPVPLLPVPIGDDLIAGDGTEAPAGVRLFVDRARRRRLDFAITAANAASIAELCRRLDGLPLAIELAASWAKLLTPAQMLTRLREILTDNDGDIPEHHRSLDAALDVSYQLLKPAIQSVFSCLSVFRGGWTLESAESICADAGVTYPVLGAVNDLLAASLVTVEESAGEMRYGMLETVRVYAGDRLRASGAEDSVRGAHRTLFLQCARDVQRRLHGVGQNAWLERLEREYANLSAALTHADPAERIGVVAGLQRFWEIRGHLSEGRRWLRDDLSGTAEIPASVRRDALLAAAGLENSAGEYASALQYIQDGLRLSESDSDRSRFQLAEASCLHYLGRDAEALTAAEAACACGLAAFGADAVEMAPFYNVLGVILKMQGARQQAAIHYERALALARKDEANRPDQVVTCQSNLGALREEDGELTEALTLFWSALQGDRRIYGRRHPRAAIRHNSLGRVWGKLGNWQNALRHHRRALDIYRETYSHPHVDIGMSHYYLGNALHSLARIGAAQAHYRQALPILERHFGKDHARCRDVKEKLRTG